MKILLIGNYEPGGQKSMQRFAAMLDRGFKSAGHETRLIRPPVVIGKIPARGKAAKWLGYADQFVVFPALLKKAVEWADVVHICDHSNAFYVKYVQHRPHIVTCHDMLAIRSALGEIACHKTSWTGRRLQSMVLRGLQDAGRTGHIVCVSQATLFDILRVARVPRNNASQIYNGLNFPYAPLDTKQAQKQIEKFGIHENQQFILHVGGNTWYKNRLGLIGIFAALKSRPEGRNLSLIMAGQPLTREMQHLLRQGEYGRDVVELLNPSDQDLRALYSRAELMCFPSLQEGFGWPIVEAQACGCPVVTSDRQPMTEVGGDAATYIDPDDTDSAAAAIASKIRKRGRPCEKSLRNSKRFSDSEMVNSYLALHEMLLATQHRYGHC